MAGLGRGLPVFLVVRGNSSKRAEDYTPVVDPLGRRRITRPHTARSNGESQLCHTVKQNKHDHDFGEDRYAEDSSTRKVERKVGPGAGEDPGFEHLLAHSGRLGSRRLWTVSRFYGRRTTRKP